MMTPMMGASPLACMLCGAAGGWALAVGLAIVFGLMVAGTIAVLAGSIAAGDFAATETRFRPLEGEHAGGSGRG